MRIRNIVRARGRRPPTSSRRRQDIADSDFNVETDHIAFFWCTVSTLEYNTLKHSRVSFVSLAILIELLSKASPAGGRLRVHDADVHSWGHLLQRRQDPAAGRSPLFPR